MVINALSITILTLALIAFLFKGIWVKIAGIGIIAVCILAISGLWDKLLS
jgi:hypothetical protein